MAAALVSAGGGLNQAARPNDPRPGTQGWPPPDARIVRPQDKIPEVAARRAGTGHPRLGHFVSRNPAWWVEEDPATGSIGRGMGPGLPLPDVAGSIPGRARVWLQDNPGLVSVSLASLPDAEELAGSTAPGRVLWVRFPHFHDGLPVLRAGLTLAIREHEGQYKVVHAGSRSLAPVKTSHRPRLTAGEALAALGTSLGVTGMRSLKEPQIAFAPEVDGKGARARTVHRLVWTFLALPDGGEPGDAHHAWIDARSGEVVALFPDALNLGTCEARPRQLHGRVRGGVRPNRADDAEQVRAFSAVVVNEDGTLKATDENGAFLYEGGAASCDLQDGHFQIRCLDCDRDSSIPGTADKDPLATGDDAGVIDFGTGGASSGSPVVGNGTSTPAGRAVAYHLEQMRQLMEKWDADNLPQITAMVNYPSVCNARSRQFALEFFKPSGICRNLGEVRDVIDHELGHTWDRLDGNDITDGAMSEWKADMFALMAGGDSCIGESTWINSSDYPTTACSGVRDLDEKAAGRQDHPLTPSECPTCATLTQSSNNCGSSTHCNGEITGQAVWHLKQNLLAGVDYITGVSLGAGNPALSAEQTKWLLEKLLLRGGPAMDDWVPIFAAVAPYDAITVEDDDDANMANGTPHAAYINAAFEHHEVQGILVADSANCAAPADPSVMATVESHPDTGRPRVRIDWTGAGSSFDVLRNWELDDGYLPVAAGVGSGPVYDDNVGVGETINYLVSAVSASGCQMISPGNNVVTVTVSHPEVRLLSALISEVVAGSDGDGKVEPGESATIQVSVSEIGGASGTTGVTATLASLGPEVRVAPGTPVSFGNLAAAGTAAGGGLFTVTVAPDAPCPEDGLELRLAVSSADGCWQDSLRLPVEGPECDVASGAHVQPVAGSLAVVADTGDGDGIADNCEIVTFQYKIENVGSVASGPIDATVTSLTSQALVLNGGTTSLAGLGPGKQATINFWVDLIQTATAAPLSFSVTTEVPGSGPVSRDYLVEAEADPPTYGTLTYDFESGAQGWDFQNDFRLSTRESTSGVQSARAGRNIISQLCDHLVSPVLRLQPGGSSQLDMNVWIEIEGDSGGEWFDRANVHVIDLDTGVHNVVTPISGLAYNASHDPVAHADLEGNICHIDEDPGWAGMQQPFAAATFDLSAWAGKDIQVEINYSSDELLHEPGIYVDDISVTDAVEIPADTQPDACDYAPEVSSPGAAVPVDVMAAGALPLAPDCGASGCLLSWEDMGTGFTYDLYAGPLGSYYDPLTGITCGSTGVTCDGTVCSYTGMLPAGDHYFLVTGTRNGRTGPFGFTGDGVLRQPLTDPCNP